MSPQSVQHPTPAAAITALMAAEPPIEIDVAFTEAAARANAWIASHVGTEHIRSMHWCECPPCEWPDDAHRPARFWLFTAHAKYTVYALTIALHHDGTMAVIGEVAEARG